MTRARALGVVLAACLVGACALAAPRGGPYPQACHDLGFSELRCRAVVARAAEQAGATLADVAAARFLPDLPNRMAEGRQAVAIVALILAGGEEHVEEISCGRTVGRQDDRVCQEDAQILGVCATLPPDPRPASVAAARPLEVPRLDIAIERTGRHEVEVGEAGIPDGYLTERRLTLAHQRPLTFLIDDGVQLLVRSIDRPLVPFGSRYRAPFDGVERVEVSVVFWVSEVDPGGILEVRDLVVR